jgi:hypothetical protein
MTTYRYRVKVENQTEFEIIQKFYFALGYNWELTPNDIKFFNFNYKMVSVVDSSDCLIPNCIYIGSSESPRDLTFKQFIDKMEEEL